MAGLRRTLTLLALGSAIISRVAVAQYGSSASLTHTVTVTVPPRVKVQLAPVASATRSTPRAASGQTADALALSINATQSWMLSIGSVTGRSPHQWSLDRDSGFATVTPRSATVASGALSPSPTPATATVFFRTSAVGGSVEPESDSTSSDAVLLTVVAP